MNKLIIALLKRIDKLLDKRLKEIKEANDLKKYNKVNRLKYQLRLYQRYAYHDFEYMGKYDEKGGKIV